jgi:hypothetical protein
LYDVTSVGAQAYMAVANELIGRTRALAGSAVAESVGAAGGAR